MLSFRLFRYIAVLGLLFALGLAGTEAKATEPARVVTSWYKLVLELVRHTPTYSPPVASRAFAYLGVASYEATASGRSDMVSLAGQLNALGVAPQRDVGKPYNDAIILHAVIARTVENFFGNTGPTGERAMKAMGRKMEKELFATVPREVAERSVNYGEAIAEHVLLWSQSDGGHAIENMGFPLFYPLKNGPDQWLPTSLIQQQQTPLLPNWGVNRTFALPSGTSCSIPAPPAYSEDPTSQFYKEAMEVYQTSKSLTEEQKIIARFWSDDPMMSPTPPGHWMSIALELLETENADEARAVDVLVRLGIAVADGFIGCWNSKYEHNLLRPVTYIRRVIDKTWDALLITPPFPEYPSGHSTQSGAAAMVLEQLYGKTHHFIDNTHEKDGLKSRQFGSFKAAAEEAALSRLYGGIHFRSAIDLGLEQGRCIGRFATALKTRN